MSFHIFPPAGNFHFKPEEAYEIIKIPHLKIQVTSNLEIMGGGGGGGGGRRNCHGHASLSVQFISFSYILPNKDAFQ